MRYPAKKNCVALNKRQRQRVDKSTNSVDWPMRRLAPVTVRTVSKVCDRLGSWKTKEMKTTTTKMLHKKKKMKAMKVFTK